MLLRKDAVLYGLTRVRKTATPFFVCFCLLLQFFSITPLLADTIKKVEIRGVDKALLDNVTSTLSIYRSRNEENISRWRIRRMHDRAEKEIKTALEPFGYYAPEITLRLVETEQGWEAKYTIIPGEPVRVSLVDIKILTTGDEVPEQQRIIGDFPLQERMVLNHELYRSGKKELLRKLAALGYIDAVYTKSEIRVVLEKKKARVILEVQTGPRYLFGQTVFEQDLLTPEFLAGFVNYSQGEPYSRRKLIELQQILYRTNYFGRVVVRGEPEKAEGLYIPVTVKMYEPEFFHKYTFGLGYATDEGVRGRVGYDNRLINRYGHSVSSELKLAEQETSVNFLYGIPVRNPRFDKLLFGAIYNEDSWEAIDTRILKANINFKHTGQRFVYGSGFELHDEKYNIGATSGDKFLPIPYLLWSLVYADDPVYTRHGVYFSVNLKGASETFFSDATFAQVLVNGKLITSPFNGFGLRLISRFSLGATAVDSIDDLPPSLRFYAGGDKSVRGFGYRELGATDSSGTVVGGKYLVFGSVELEKRIYENWSVAAFADAGKGVNDLDDDLGRSVGVGVRYRLPFGQIRLDVASAISEADDPLRLHLTIGGDF